MTEQRRVNEILRLPYQRVLVPDAETGGFTATIAEFPGCIAEGDTPAEAYEALERVAAEWLAAILEEGQEVPPPAAAHEYSGRVVLRMPRSLHGRAAEVAASEGVSLNTFLVAAVAERVGSVRTRSVRASTSQHTRFLTFVSRQSAATANLINEPGTRPENWDAPANSPTGFSSVLLFNVPSFASRRDLEGAVRREVARG